MFCSLQIQLLFVTLIFIPFIDCDQVVTQSNKGCLPGFFSSSSFLFFNIKNMPL